MKNGLFELLRIVRPEMRSIAPSTRRRNRGILLSIVTAVELQKWILYCVFVEQKGRSWE